MLVDKWSRKRFYLIFFVIRVVHVMCSLETLHYSLVMACVCVCVCTCIHSLIIWVWWNPRYIVLSAYHLRLAEVTACRVLHIQLSGGCNLWSNPTLFPDVGYCTIKGPNPGLYPVVGQVCLLPGYVNWIWQFHANTWNGMCVIIWSVHTWQIVSQC